MMDEKTLDDYLQQCLRDATQIPADPPGSAPAESSQARRQMPTRPLNADVRSREHLTPEEVEAMCKAAATVGRHRNRDRTLILMGYRHGLRNSEISGLRWDSLSLTNISNAYVSASNHNGSLIHIVRTKRGNPSIHPLGSTEIRGLNRIRKDYPSSTRYIFTSEQGGQLSQSSIRAIVSRAGRLAGLGFPVHPHMLRHACGYKLAADGVDTRAIQAYLGHRNIQTTVRYTDLAPGRFDGLWDD